MAQPTCRARFETPQKTIDVQAIFEVARKITSPEARRIYFDRFRQLLFAQTQGGIVKSLKTLPPAPGPGAPEYQPTYDALKAYLITTSNSDKSTREFLPPVLMTWWKNNRTVDAERTQLARKQFDYYENELHESNPFSKENDAPAIDRSRRYLAQSFISILRGRGPDSR